MLAFEKAEYQKRIKLVKQRMSAKGIDVLLVTDPANMNYLTGYNGWSFYVHQLVVIIIDQEQPLWIGRCQDANGAKLTTWLDHRHIIPYSDDYVQSSIRHPMDFVALILHELGQADRAIGLEMDAYYFTAQCYTRLLKGLSKMEFCDATALVNHVRIIKSDAEIEKMRKAARIVERAMQVGIDAIDVGVRECDVVAKVYHTQISGTETFGGDYPAIVPLLPSGKKTSTPHLTWTDQPYKLGDPVILELAGCYQRYHCPLARTVFLGSPPKRLVDLAEVVIEGIHVTLEAVKPGVTCLEVEAAWKKSIAKSGFKKNSRIGYSMGLNYPPDWGEHTASLRKEDTTILQPNMTFHLIPGIWLDQFGVELSEPFVVTNTGCEILTQFPRELMIKN